MINYSVSPSHNSSEPQPWAQSWPVGYTPPRSRLYNHPHSRSRSSPPAHWCSTAWCSGAWSRSCTRTLSCCGTPAPSPWCSSSGPPCSLSSATQHCPSLSSSWRTWWTKQPTKYFNFFFLNHIINEAQISGLLVLFHWMFIDWLTTDWLAYVPRTEVLWRSCTVPQWLVDNSSGMLSDTPLCPPSCHTWDHSPPEVCRSCHECLQRLRLASETTTPSSLKYNITKALAFKDFL